MKLSIALLAMIFSSAVFAQATRVAVVNSDVIFSQSKTATKAQSKLQEEFQDQQKALLSAAEELKALAEKYEKNAPVMKDDERVRMQKVLAEKDEAFQEKQRKFVANLEERKRDVMQDILQKANRIIREIAQSEKIDLVLQDAVYASKTVDITDKVLAKLDDAKN